MGVGGWLVGLLLLGGVVIGGVVVIGWGCFYWCFYRRRELPQQSVTTTPPGPAACPSLSLDAVFRVFFLSVLAVRFT